MSKSSRSKETDAAAQQVNELSARMIELTRKNSLAWLHAYEKVFGNMLQLQQRAIASSQIEWINALAATNANLMREMSAAYFKTVSDGLTRIQLLSLLARWAPGVTLANWRTAPYLRWNSGPAATPSPRVRSRNNIVISEEFSSLPSPHCWICGSNQNQLPRPRTQSRACWSPPERSPVASASTSLWTPRTRPTCC
jgi:hypothetical protein